MRMANTVLGIDLQSFPSSKRSAMKYSAVLLRAGLAVERLQGLTSNDLTRLIGRVKPEIVATDNIHELARTKEGLRSVLKSLQGGTKIIQVTGPPGKQVSLQALARASGLDPPPRFSSTDEAEAIARLASLGVGSEVHLFESETKITVSRSVSLGPGGQSQSRYRRSIHSSILHAARRISRLLEEAGLDFDYFEEKSDFGLDRAEISAYAPISTIQTIIRPEEAPFWKVSIEPVPSKDIEYVETDNRLPCEETSRKLIVGVDPGTTCGLAIVDFHSVPVLIYSKKGTTRGDIVRIVTRLGEPVIMASDVLESPRFVEKLASSLNAVLFRPQCAMSAVEKLSIVQEFSDESGITARNSHERDALAAAFKAYKHYRNKFRQIELRIERMHADVSPDSTKALVVKGYSIQDAMESLETPKRKEEVVSALPAYSTMDQDPEKLSLRRVVRRQRLQQDRLERDNERLRSDLARLQSEFHSLNRDMEAENKESLRAVRRERLYGTMRNEIVNLRREMSKQKDTILNLRRRLDRISEFRNLESRGDVMLIKPINSFTVDGVRDAIQLRNVKAGDLVMLLEAGGGGALAAQELAKIAVAGVVAVNEMSHQANSVFEKHGIPVLRQNELGIVWVEGLPFVSISGFKRILQDWRIARKKTNASHQILDTVVIQYRKMRLERLTEGQHESMCEEDGKTEEINRQ